MDRYQAQNFVDKRVPICIVSTSSGPRGIPNIADLLSPQNPNLFREFFYYCCSEFGVENLMCLMVTSDYRKNPTFEKAHFIRQTFLGPQAPYELNTNRINIDAVDQRLNYYAGMHVYAQTPHFDIFDAIRKDASTNVTDTMGRFSAAYLQKKLGAQWLYKVPAELYIRNMPPYVVLLRAIKDVGVKLPPSLSV